MNSEHYEELVALAWGMAKEVEQSMTDSIRSQLRPLGIKVEDDKKTTANRLQIAEQIAFRMALCMAEALIRHGPKQQKHQENIIAAFDRFLEAVGLRASPPPTGGGKQA